MFVEDIHCKNTTLLDPRKDMKINGASRFIQIDSMSQPVLVKLDQVHSVRESVTENSATQLF